MNHAVHAALHCVHLASLCYQLHQQFLLLFLCPSPAIQHKLLRGASSCSNKAMADAMQTVASNACGQVTG